MKHIIGNITIRRLILLMFVLALFISISFSGALIFTNWIASAKKTAEQVATDISDYIYDQVYSFLQKPFQINKINHKIIENGMLDLTDEIQRERFFVGVLESYKNEIYSFSYGTAKGEYYGARQNENGVIEIMRNNAETGGNSWYYTVTEDLRAGELVVQAGSFDPRTRAWYKEAVEVGEPTFSPVYKHFVIDDLAVSVSCPVYNQDGVLQGVLGTHLLLSDIGTYLQNAVKEYGGIAIIMEKDSTGLIANSMGAANFEVLQDGAFERHGLDDIDNTDIQNAYRQYEKNRLPLQFFRGQKDNYYVNTREIQLGGINWILISAIPESFFMADVIRTMNWSGLITLLLLILSVLTYTVFMRKLLIPMKSLLQVSAELSAGDLSKRVKVVRNDEIGLISKSFNSVADKMQSLIDNLENIVQMRTEELRKANQALEESREELRLILDSSAEAIYGIDLNGKCTFCNSSCIKTLGYTRQEELLGQDMHKQIHHSRRDGTPFPPDECKIYMSIKQGVGHSADDEVFWRADGTPFDVEYHAHPQIKEGKVIGGVIAFMDITDRRKRDEEIKRLSNHDVLTGLYNRRSFEENRRIIDVPDNLPLSVIFADINGLKMTNDVFGHAAGDELIKKSSEILKRACRSDDILARVGGDEFIILLPNTTEKNAEKVVERIKSEFLDARVAAIKCSISLGLDTKSSPEQSLDEIIANAENAMYKDKTLNRKSINKDIIDTIIGTLHSRSPMEKQHSIAVSELCNKIGLSLQLSEPEIDKLKRAGYLHDIGKIVLEESILLKDFLSDEELEKMRQHSVVGYRILNLFDDTLDLAEYVYGHHERWDGAGYPRGLKGEQIPLISRIISVAETYDRILNREKSGNKAAAAEKIKKGAGTQFDPHIAQKLIQIIQEENGNHP